MFRAKFVLLNPNYVPLEPNQTEGPVDTLEVWRPVEHALPLPDGSLQGHIDGQFFVIQEGEWREDRDI